MNLDIVIVTYNRLQKLKKALDLYERQTVPFRSIIVVDNCSTDGTFSFLKEWEKTKRNYNKHVIFLSENLGGSGGFYEGQKYAMSLNPDWIYISDDDAYPQLNLIELFYDFLPKFQNERIAAICATVLNSDGTIAYDHRSNYQIKYNLKFVRNNSTPLDYNKPYFKIKLFSYVASFINAKALKDVGLCNPLFFIYYDDTEHSIRLTRYGNIYCYPLLKVYHDNGALSSGNNNQSTVSWRKYYSIRNEIYTLIKYHKLAAIYLTCRILYHLFKQAITQPNKRKRIYITITAIKDAWCKKMNKHYKYKP